MDTGDWRAHCSSYLRSKIVNNLTKTLTKEVHPDNSGLFGLIDLRSVVVRFEEQVFMSAKNQTEYIRRISPENAAGSSSSDFASGSSSSDFYSDANSSPLVHEPSLPDKEPDVSTSDWRTQQPPDSRQKNINALMESLKTHVAHSGQEGIEELMRIAVSYEEMIFNTAKSQEDYLGKLSIMM